MTLMLARIVPRGAMILPFLFAVSLLLSGAPPVEAGNLYDHLKCYKLKYNKDQRWGANPHGQDPLTLIPLQMPPFAVEQGCRLVPKKNPRPKELCIPVDKNPRQQPNGDQLIFDYACYVMRCPPEQDFVQPLLNQFGSGDPIVKRKTRFRRLCVPTLKIVP